MEVYSGRLRESAGVCSVLIVGGDVAGEIDCFECGGTGWWDFMEPYIDADYCVDCKGTGRILISV